MKFEQPTRHPPPQSNANTQDVNTQLMEAAWDGNCHAANVAIASGANIEYVGGHHNGTALAAAARNGHMQVLDVLLQNGANVHAVSGGPWFHSPLDFAAFYLIK